MDKVNQEFLNGETSRISTLVCEFSDEFLEIYSHINDHVKSYVYGPSVTSFRGYYNPSPVAHLAIGGAQKGPKPKTDISKIKGGEIYIYGLDEKGRPIYIRTMISSDRMGKEFEIVSYSANRVLGITFDEYYPIYVHETQFQSNKVVSIVTCQFDHGKPSTLENCRELKLEQFDYDKSNHFFWRFLNYDPHFISNFPEVLLNLYKESGYQPKPIWELTYEFETNEKGSVIKMYGDGFEKTFNKKKSETTKGVISSKTPTKKSKMIFQKMVDEAAIRIDHFNFDEFTGMIKEFMSVKFKCAEDDLLFETGVFDTIYGEDTFTANFVRQFTIHDKNDVYEHMEQLHIVLSYENKKKMENLQCTEWCFDGSSLEEFIDKIKTLPVYECLKDIETIKSISIFHTLI